MDDVGGMISLVRQVAQPVIRVADHVIRAADLLRQLGYPAHDVVGVIFFTGAIHHGDQPAVIVVGRSGAVVKGYRSRILHARRAHVVAHGRETIQSVIGVTSNDSTSVGAGLYAPEIEIDVAPRAALGEGC